MYLRLFNQVFFCYLKALCMPLGTEHIIIQINAAACPGGTNVDGPIFSESATDIRFNVSDGITFNTSGDCDLLADICYGDFSKLK